MATQDFAYIVWMLRQAIDFAEMEQDFVPLRKWANKVERTGQEFEALENRLTLPAGENVLMNTLRAVSMGQIKPEEAIQQVQHWLANGEIPIPKTEAVSQYEFA